MWPLSSLIGKHGFTVYNLHDLISCDCLQVSGVLQQVLAGISEVLQQVMSHPRAAQLVDLPFPFHSARGYSGALSCRP